MERTAGRAAIWLVAAFLVSLLTGLNWMQTGTTTLAGAALAAAGTLETSYSINGTDDGYLGRN